MRAVARSRLERGGCGGHSRCLAIARRGISPDHLGAGLRQSFGRIKALLPMGHEGEQLFDIEPVIAILKDAER
jgi:hypothetical protein